MFSADTLRMHTFRNDMCEAWEHSIALSGVKSLYMEGLGVGHTGGIL